MIVKENITIGGREFIHRYSTLSKGIAYGGESYLDILELASNAGNDELYVECSEESSDKVLTDDFWMIFQRNGTRRDYSYAFARWERTKISPLYKLICENCMYLLLNASVGDASAIIVECTSSGASMLGVCMGCSNMTLPPVFTFTTTPFVKTWTSAFAGCESMTECTLHFGDNTLSEATQEADYPIKNRNNMQNTFFKCSALTNITFMGMGSPKSLDLSDCVNLSAESIVSLSQHLYDVSSATAGNYVIKIASTTMEALGYYDEENNTDTVSAMENLGWAIEEVEVETEEPNLQK